MSQTFRFSVRAAAAPATLPRVLEVLALHGHVPQACEAKLSRDGYEYRIELDLAGVDQEQARLLAKRMERVVDVTSVLQAELRRQAA